MGNALPISTVFGVFASLQRSGQMWPSSLRCETCGSLEDVYETHKDFIDAARQVNVCKSCLVSMVLRIDRDADANNQ